MRNEGERTEDGWCGFGGGRERRGEVGREGEWREGRHSFVFSEIGILSFTAGLVGPDIKPK